MLQACSQLHARVCRHSSLHRLMQQPAACAAASLGQAQWHLPLQGENVLTMVPALERKITDFNEDAGFCQTGADADGCIVPDEVLVCGTVSCLMSISCRDAISSGRMPEHSGEWQGHDCIAALPHRCRLPCILQSRSEADCMAHRSAATTLHGAGGHSQPEYSVCTAQRLLSRTLIRRQRQSRPAADPLQVDELFVTMVSVHGQGGWFKNDTDKAASAISLTTKVYRDYMDTIAKAHPEVHKA
jgi:hypothetical protein